MKRIFKYAAVGLWGLVVNEGFLWFFTEIGGLYYLISSIIAIEISILSNFFLNNFWTFADVKKDDSVFFRLSKFHGVAIIVILVNISILYILVTFFNVYYLLANIVGIFVTFIVTYTLNTHFTWKVIR